MSTIEPVPVAERAALAALLEDPCSLAIAVQPMVDLATGRVVGHEALSRFPDGAPDAWFARARRCGLGPELEALAVRRALALGPPPTATFLSVNVSPSALISDVLLTALPPDLHGVVVEVTEHEAISEHGLVVAVLDELRARGARVALDDAGVGYAGLRQVMALRPDIIKLDRSLITDVDADPAKAALVDSFTRFARRTDSVVCAEGIETEAELEVLGDLDVSYGQGYRLARPGTPWPAPGEEVARRLRLRSSRPHRGPTGVSGPVDTGDRRLEQVCARLSRLESTTELTAACRPIAEELAADELALSTWDPLRRTVATVHATAGWPDALPTYELAGLPATEHVLLAQEAVQVLVTDPAADPAEVALLTDDGFAALLMVPVIARGRTLGLLEAVRFDEQAFSRSQVNRARIVAYQLGGLLDAGRLGGPARDGGFVAGFAAPVPESDAAWARPTTAPPAAPTTRPTC
jgi:EAL domain-containing protein (putative c-di-GMP-specific phosphodiesterase class I)